VVTDAVGTARQRYERGGQQHLQGFGGACRALTIAAQLLHGPVHGFSLRPAIRAQHLPGVRQHISANGDWPPALDI
jgi:hypothetical protein